MDFGIYATVEHRKLMELKNCGAVDADTLEQAAEKRFEEVKDVIKAVRGSERKEKKGIAKFFSFTLPINKDVDLMFSNRQELIEHLCAVEVPTKLCPISQKMKESFLFLDRAALYSKEAKNILDVFKRHNEVIVDSDRSLIVEWILQNAARIREEIKGV